MSQGKAFRLQGSIHDVQDLFLGFRAIMQLGSLADQKQVIVDVRREILSYNKELAERYNLPKPRDVGLSVAEDVVSVLKSIGLLESRARSGCTLREPLNRTEASSAPS